MHCRATQEVMGIVCQRGVVHKASEDTRMDPGGTARRKAFLRFCVTPGVGSLGISPYTGASSVGEDFYGEMNVRVLLEWLLIVQVRSCTYKLEPLVVYHMFRTVHAIKCTKCITFNQPTASGVAFGSYTFTVP